METAGENSPTVVADLDVGDGVLERIGEEDTLLEASGGFLEFADYGPRAEVEEDEVLPLTRRVEQQETKLDRDHCTKMAEVRKKRRKEIL